MITYRLTFNSKSKSHKIPEAIKIAKDNFSKTYTQTGDAITILTVQCNRSFTRLLRLIINLKGTKLEIDNETIFEKDNFISIMECENKRKCNGICTILHDYDFQLEVLGITKKDPDAFYNSGRWAFLNYDDAIEKSTPNYLILKRDVYLKHYLQDTTLPAKTCKTYNRVKIIEAFNALPTHIRIEFPDDNYSIIDQLIKAENGQGSNGSDGEMVVDISEKSIKELGQVIAKRLWELNTIDKK